MNENEGSDLESLNGLENEDGTKSDKKSEKKPEKLKKKALKSENEKLHEKLDHLEKLMQTKDKELTEQISKFAFLQAELENARKIYTKQQDLVRSRTKANVLTSFTPLIDSFEMAFKNHTEIIEGTCSPQLAKYIKGFEGIQNQLSDIFDSYRVKSIDAINVPFDYNEHEVMLRVLNDNLPEDTVLQVAQKGYRMNGQVIRPAKVIVSKVTPPPPAPEPVKETPPEASDPNSASTSEQPSPEPDASEIPDSPPSSTSTQEDK